MLLRNSRKCSGLIEAKIATCDIKTKYSGDYKLMKSYLETKLVGTTERRKGGTQLLAAVVNIVKGPKEALPPYLAKVNKLIPLIVTKDEVGSSYIINTYLDKRFEEQIKRKEYRQTTITPLVASRPSWRLSAAIIGGAQLPSMWPDRRKKPPIRGTDSCRSATTQERDWIPEDCNVSRHGGS